MATRSPCPDSEICGESSGESERRAPDVGEGQPFIFEHQVIERLVGDRHPKHVDDGLRGADERAQGDSVEDDWLNLEWCAGTDQRSQPLVGEVGRRAEADLFRSS